MDEFRPKPWLTPAQQVKHLESEGIKFELTSKDDAERYLEKNNNFFRINLFRKGFPTYVGGPNDGLFINLDFGMLRDIAIIDYEFRQVLLSISIDVEHFSKLQLLRFLEAHQDDGYLIVEKYISSKDQKLDNGKTVNLVKSEINRGANGCYTNQIIADYPGYRYPVWAFVELIPFGTFNNFLLYVAKRYRDKKLQSRFYQLQSVKALRNACGHNNCIIDDLKGGDPSYQIGRNVKNALRAIGYSDITLSTKLSNDRIQQIATTLYLHHLIASSGVVAAKGVQLHQSVDRMYRNAQYYDKNDPVKSSFSFFKGMIDAWYPIV